MIKETNLKEIAKRLSSDKLDFISAFRRNMYAYVDDKDITLEDISNASGTNISTLKTFLYSGSKDMHVTNVVKFARALEVSVDELIGAETIPPVTMESIQMCRDLPENDLYLVRWFIRYLHRLNENTAPNKRLLSVMELECNGNGNLKITTQYRKIDITDIDPEIKGKVFFGITMPCDHYMPIYSPYDILLIANDRPPKLNENCLIRMNGLLHIAKRKSEKGSVRYYSIRDGKYRVDQSEIDELIGYIALKVTESKSSADNLR